MKKLFVENEPPRLSNRCLYEGLRFSADLLDLFSVLATATSVNATVIVELRPSHFGRKKILDCTLDSRMAKTSPVL